MSISNSKKISDTPLPISVTPLPISVTPLPISVTPLPISLQIVSDLHLEMHEPNIRLTDILIPGADYLVLAGDIGYPEDTNYADFLKQCSEVFQKVFIITGNHEYYSKQSMVWIDRLIQSICDDMDNVYFLNNTTYDDPDTGYLFIGTTLWSRVDRYKEMIIQSQMNDYHLISDGKSEPITPHDTNKLYDMNLEWLTDRINHNSDKKIIVITHHMPSFRFIDEQYKRSLCNSAFANNLEYLTKDNPNIRCWIFGHTHSSIISKIGECDYICNPSGYLENDQTFENNKYDKRSIYRLD
jgi:predicted phosphodiesterase